MVIKFFLLLALFLFSFNSFGQNQVDYKKIFSGREGCFFILELGTRKVIDEFNAAQCAERFSPYSSFKIAAAMMAFELQIFKDENQVIPWDGKKRGRKEIDQNLTPKTFMSSSAKWVTEWIMPQVGDKEIASFLKAFSYGNQDFSGGLKDAWVSSSLKISAREQVDFLSNFWEGKIGLSENTTRLTKKVMFIRTLGKNARLYGKTGTGCLEAISCQDRPGKMIGWFVGVLESNTKSYVFAGNARDLQPVGPPAGPRMQASVLQILDQLGLI